MTSFFFFFFFFLFLWRTKHRKKKEKSLDPSRVVAASDALARITTRTLSSCQVVNLVLRIPCFCLLTSPNSDSLIQGKRFFVLHAP